MIENDNFEITERDFFIQVKPTFDERDEWNGEVNITVAYPPRNVLTKQAYSGIDFFVKMLVCSVSVMEIDQHVREAIHNYVAENYPEDFSDTYERDGKLIDIEHDGNIIKLNFIKDTEGSA